MYMYIVQLSFKASLGSSGL